MNLKELNEELKNGNELARDLVEHLNCMGADRYEKTITTENGCYIVKVIKTL